MRRKRLSAAEIGAYLDGTAPPEERRRIAQEILRNPDASARLRLYRQQAQELHRLYDGVMDEPIPDRLRDLLTRGADGRDAVGPHEDGDGGGSGGGGPSAA